MLGTDDERTLKVHTAPRGGRFKIVADGMLYRIKSEHGGVLPEFAKTKFTSMKRAEQALQRYFDQNPKSEPKLTPEQEKRKQHRLKLEE